ncbi:MAG: cobalamin-independent methionine synthase II family protein [Woeseiaceae bacterium]|nr:cobalamin-independent methionine synthase II family protein [Woeseiaceae bacterium]
MKTSAERILTTHVGSLPRSAELADILLRRDKGEAYDSDEYDRIVADAVMGVVHRQAETGIDVPSDGEQSKVGYATYMMDRLHGFGGDTERKPARDFVDYPELLAAIGRMMGRQQFRRAACIAEIAVKDWTPLKNDIENFKAAIHSASVDEAFMNSASPGLVTAFQPNRYYASHEEYLWAVANVMREEYEQIVAAGLVLQLDCPDLAMARHTGFQELTEDEFLKRAEQHVEAMNHALENVPADRCRFHVCWGNYEGPHDFDIEVKKILPLIFKAKPQAMLFEAANARHEHEWRDWATANIPDDKILIPGVIDTCTNLIEHPELVAQRIERFVDIVGRDRVIAGTDCGFGTFAGYGRVDERIAWRKLESLVAGAAIASARV